MFATYGGTGGQIINFGETINSGITGDGVTIAIVDEGLELAHEDLSDNIVAGSWDFVNADNDPTNPALNGDHGTGVAGLAAAVGWNDKGSMGIAPEASLIGYNFLLNQSTSNQLQSWGSVHL